MAGARSDDAAAQAAPPETIEALFVAQESALLNYAHRLVANEDTAQDLVQEAFLKLNDCYGTVRQPRPWLFRTVHNLALNHLRSERKIVPLGLDAGGREPIDTQPMPDVRAERLDAIGHVRRSLETLDARSRELVQLKFVEGLSYQQISARTKLGIGNVGYLLHHALKHLAAELKKTGVVP